MVRTHKEFKDIKKTVMNEYKADEVELRIINNNTALTRYANSKIHQNLGKNESEISIRAVIGNKVGYSSTNSFNDNSIKNCLKEAESIAKIQKGDPDFKGLPPSKEINKEIDTYFKDTEENTPNNRAEKVKDIVDLAKNKNVDRVFGAFKIQTHNLFVANSNGIEKFSRYTSSNLTTTAIADWDNDKGFGWGESCSSDVREIDHLEVGRTAVEKGLNNLNPKKINAGEYNVILEPLAVKSILLNMNIMGFSGKKVQEETSFMNGKFGEKIVDKDVNIYDDVYDIDTIGHTFDFEGVPKKRVNIIKNGIANEVVHDSYSSGREDDKESTGHALQMPDSKSPLPTNLLMDTGDYSKEEMIEDTQRGILVTRFHYCNPIHHSKSILTGLTRDGTWLIKDGEIKHPVNNFRFTQSLIDAFDNIEGIGKERELFSHDIIPAYLTVPALKISNFDFTGTTEF
ncbi:MAG: TldD/PmbA family protein [Thermoplasmatota archaeon]